MIEIRPSNPDEAPYLQQWLTEPAILRWFPMTDAREIEDSVKIWMGYSRFQACFTVYENGTPVGMSTLYLQPYQKFAHQCLFAIIIDEKHRNKGIGKMLMEHMISAAKNQFKIEILHLEVYQGNPAMRLYERLGFKEFGRQPKFIKLGEEYLDKIMMQKELS
ncbi:MAG TPA: GNAT family N-acetyltransferase [Rhabdochlamydiaceae bacterium]|jgi:putative acetyltransferase|nr:GNAT family N-acetyltransferase [Rhabdochlamydiaceae bacterium]